MIYDVCIYVHTYINTHERRYISKPEDADLTGGSTKASDSTN